MILAISVKSVHYKTRERKYEMKNTYSIRNLIALLMSKIWLIIIVTVVFGAGSFLISKFMINPRYESFTTMYVKNNSVSTEKDANVDLNDLNASKSLASTYITVLKSNAVMKQVGVKLTELYDMDDLALLFNIKNNEITVSSIKNSFTEIAPEFLIRVVGAGSVEIIDYASPDKEPVSPNVPLVSVIGIIFGFSIAVFVILLTDFFDDTVKETEELTKRYNKAILGEVQTIETDKTKNKKKKGTGIEKRSLLSDEGIPFNVAESYKSIRSNIMFTLGTTDKKVIAVSSPNPSEGKSTTAANIAIALAQTDNSVLLIDADLRKPVQHKIFKKRNNDGLSTLIIKKTTPDKAIKSNVVNGLDLLTSGPMPPNPSELLASERFKELFEKLAEKYDYVVIDTPPVNVVSDALVIKDLISGILMVLKYSFTTYEDLASCMKQIELAKANTLGFVLNEVDYSRGSSNYRYKYYSYANGGYGYGYGRRYSSDDDNDESES